jgi:uncharacterized protein YciI
MPYFALFYDVVDDFSAKRLPFRPDHQHTIEEAHRRGELLLAGALREADGDAVNGALLIFRGADRSVAENFATSDPYVKAHLVTRWVVRPYMQVIATQPGEDALVKA